MKKAASKPAPAALISSETLIFKTAANESLALLLERRTRIFPQLKYLYSKHIQGPVTGEQDQDHQRFSEEIEKGIFVGVTPKTWKGSYLFPITTNRLLRPKDGADVIFKKLKEKLKDNPRLASDIGDASVPLEEIAEIVHVGLILGRSLQKVPPMDHEIYFKSPIDALNLVQRRRKYYLRVLLKAADELEVTVLPVLRECCWWGSDDDELAKHGPWDNLPAMLKQAAGALKKAELSTTLEASSSYTDRRRGDRSYDSAILGLVLRFKQEDGKPRHRLVADIISDVFKKQLGEDEVKKIAARESCRVNKLLKKLPR